jgi:hypothetical protein
MTARSCAFGIPACDVVWAAGGLFERGQQRLALGRQPCLQFLQAQIDRLYPARLGQGHLHPELISTPPDSVL